MVKTIWSEKDNEIVSKNFLAGIDYQTTANSLPHLKISSIFMKYKNCLYLQKGNVKGSLQNASSKHIEIWKKIVLPSST